jgi:DNA-binding transcriptional regulator YhcF (GntR family)
MKRKSRFKKTSHNIPCKDHLGNKYPSIKDMCKVYGVNPETYSRRIKVYKMTVEEALTRPVKRNGGQQIRDHKGTLYKSHTRMCEHYGISRKLFEYRIAHGWSLEAALTTPPKTRKPAED